MICTPHGKRFARVDWCHIFQAEIALEFDVSMCSRCHQPRTTGRVRTTPPPHLATTVLIRPDEAHFAWTRCDHFRGVRGQGGSTAQWTGRRSAFSEGLGSEVSAPRSDEQCGSACVNQKKRTEHYGVGESISYTKALRRRSTAVPSSSWKLPVQASRRGAPTTRVVSNGAIQVFDIWESQADFDAFGPTLMPILTELGVGRRSRWLPRSTT